MGLGQVLGPLIGTFIAKHRSFIVLQLISAVAVVFSAIVFFFAFQGGRSTAEPHTATGIRGLQTALLPEEDPNGSFSDDSGAL